MEIEGYALIKTGAKGTSAVDLSNFYDHPVRVLEFASDGGVLVVDPQGSGLAMFDKKDVLRSFRCKVFGEVVCPPDLDYPGLLVYHTKCLFRKGGYHPIMRQLVVAASLHRGEFCDSVLWEKQ